MNLSLFIVVLGGRSLKSNIELHDVRWVLGETIEDTFPELRKQWLGKKSGLHIDSYKCIRYVDGYIFFNSATRNYISWISNTSNHSTNHMVSFNPKLVFV